MLLFNHQGVAPRLSLGIIHKNNRHDLAGSRRLFFYEYQNKKYKYQCDNILIFIHSASPPHLTNSYKTM